MSGSYCVVLELVPPGGEKTFKPRPRNRILIPLRGSFHDFRSFFDFFMGVTLPVSYLKPVNGTAVDKGREHPQSVPEGVSYRTHT